MDWFFGTGSSKWATKNDLKMLEVKMDILMKRMEAMEQHIKEKVKKSRREEEEREQMRREIRERLKIEEERLKLRDKRRRIGS